MTNTGLILMTEVIYGLIGISGLVSNFLIAYIILCCLSEKTRNLITTRCILHLSLSDLLIAFFIPFLISDLRYKNWPFSSFTCDLFNLALLTQHFTKSFLLIFFGITVLAVFKGQVLDLNQIKISLIITMCWLFGFIISFFLVLNGEKRGRCNVFWHSNDFFDYREAFTLMYTILIYLAPLTLLIFLFREKRLNIVLDEQQIKIKQTLNLVLFMLIVHTLLNTLHLICQWIFTFDVEYDLTVRGESLEINRNWKTILYCISSWFLYSELFIFPAIYYRLCRKFGYGFVDLLDSMSQNGTYIQNYLQELKESNRLGQIYYKPVALYDKVKNNIKNSI